MNEYSRTQIVSYQYLYQTNERFLKGILFYLCMELMSSYQQENELYNTTISMADYYMMKENFKNVEEQLNQMERQVSKKFLSSRKKQRKDFELECYLLKANLNTLHKLLPEYCKKVPIETNYTFRLKEIEQRANQLFAKLAHFL